MRSKIIIALALIVLVSMGILLPQLLGADRDMTIDISKAGNIARNIPAEIKQDIDKNRPNAKMEEKEVIEGFADKFLYDYNNAPPPPELIGAYAAGDERRQKGSSIFIKKEKAISDVDYLFACLKYGYAGYKYFGGDPTFDKAKSNIVSEINNWNGDIASGNLQHIIYKNLEFVQDGHFAIGQKGTAKRYNMFLSEKYDIQKESNRYYLLDKSGKQEITAVDGDLPGNYIKPSIDEAGKAIYRFCVRRQSQEDKITLNVKAGGTSLTAVLDNLRNIYRGQRPGKGYTYKERYGVSTIKLASFAPSDDTEAFVKDAPKLRGKGVVIIDLRGNGGGNDLYALDWVKNFTGKACEYPAISASLCTDLAKNALINTIKRSYGEKYYLQCEKIIEEEYSLKDGINKYWSKIDYLGSSKISNNTPIFVLMDMKSASAAESFISILRELDNVYFVGSNSSGTRDFGNLAQYVLPESKIKMMFGSTVFSDADLQLKDGLGIEPDFWMNPKDAEKRVLKFISNYAK